MSEKDEKNKIDDRLDSFEHRLNALEAKLEMEREDLEKLKEVADQDHRRLEKISHKSPSASVFSVSCWALIESNFQFTP